MSSSTCTYGLSEVCSQPAQERVGPRYSYCRCGVQIDAAEKTCIPCKVGQSSGRDYCKASYRSLVSGRAKLGDLVVACLERYGPMTVYELAAEIGCHRATVSLKANSMHKAGTVVFDKGGRGGAGKIRLP